MDLATRIFDRTRRHEQAPSDAPSDAPAAAGGCCAFELAEDDEPELTGA